MNPTDPQWTPIIARNDDSPAVDVTGSLAPLWIVAAILVVVLAFIFISGRRMER